MTFLEKLKAWVNRIPIPPLLNFFYLATAKNPYRPTWQEIKASAPDPSQNWTRLKLDSVTSLDQPVWKIFLIAIAIIAIYVGSQSLKFSIDVIANFGAVILLLAVLYWIYKSFTK